MTPPGRTVFVAPHFLEIAGRADMPGPVRRACAFTTASAAAPWRPSHRHRCDLFSASGSWQEDSVRWRTRTVPLDGAEGAAAAPRLAEGEAEGLLAAITAALSAAQQEGEAMLCHAPRFVAMEREPGLPRVWACSQMSATGQVTPERPWTEMQTAYIRERPGHPQRFHCTLEVVPFTAVMGPEAGEADQGSRKQWWAPDLDAAIQGCEGRMFSGF